MKMHIIKMQLKPEGLKLSRIEIRIKSNEGKEAKENGYFLSPN